MFFICGVNQGRKELSHNQLVICANCGGYGRYQVLMTYMCLSLFFIPVLKWGKKYYVKMSCCGTIYELNPEAGGRIARGDQVEIGQRDLTMVQAGSRQQWQPTQTQSGQWQSGPGTRKVCQNCGYETEEDFSFCPKCGGKL